MVYIYMISCVLYNTLNILANKYLHHLQCLGKRFSLQCILTLFYNEYKVLPKRLTVYAKLIFPLYMKDLNSDLLSKLK